MPRGRLELPTSRSGTGCAIRCANGAYVMSRMHGPPYLCLINKALLCSGARAERIPLVETPSSFANVWRRVEEDKTNGQNNMPSNHVEYSAVA